jgi:hypothetical protein
MALTRGYAPPEQEAQDVEDLGPWTDFYALGATLFKLLTNEEKLPSSSKLQNGYELTFPDSVSQRTRDLVRWMMNPARLKRPRNVAEIRNFLNSKVQDTAKENTDATIIVDANNANDTKADKDETVVINTPKAKPETKPEVKPEQPKLAAVEQEPEPPKKSSHFVRNLLFFIIVLFIGGWWYSHKGVDSSMYDGQDTEVHAKIESLLADYESLVQQAVYAESYNEFEARLYESDAVDKELSNLTAQFNEEQWKKYDDLKDQIKEIRSNRNDESAEGPAQEWK